MKFIRKLFGCNPPEMPTVEPEPTYEDVEVQDMEVRWEFGKNTVEVEIFKGSQRTAVSWVAFGGDFTDERLQIRINNWKKSEWRTINGTGYRYTDLIGYTTTPITRIVKVKVSQ